MSASDFRFPLTEVKESGQLPVNAMTGPETFPDALSEGALVGPVFLDGMILAVDDEASFTGEAQGRWRFECTRCLRLVEEAWRAPIEVMVPIDGGPMDLTDEVRQTIALAQPMKIVCKPDCKGLCPACKKNRNEVDCGHPDAPEGDGGGPAGPLERMHRPRLTPRPNKG
jgi:uncharacterized protein